MAWWLGALAAPPEAVYFISSTYMVPQLTACSAQNTYRQNTHTNKKHSKNKNIFLNS